MHPFVFCRGIYYRCSKRHQKILNFTEEIKMANYEFKNKDNRNLNNQLASAYDKINTTGWGASKEMKALRTATQTAMKALEDYDKSFSNEELDRGKLKKDLDKKMIRLYKMSREYEEQKKMKSDGKTKTDNAHDNPDWQPKSGYGQTRLQGSRDLQNIVRNLYENDTKKVDDIFDTAVDASRLARKQAINPTAPGDYVSLGKFGHAFEQNKIEPLAVMYSADTLRQKFVNNDKDVTFINNSITMTTAIQDGTKRALNHEQFTRPLQNLSLGEISDLALGGVPAVKEKVFSENLNAQIKQSEALQTLANTFAKRPELEDSYNRLMPKAPGF